MAADPKAPALDLRSGESDGRLVEQSLAGDNDAFGRLYERYRSVVYASCLRRLRDPGLAEDATQDTFLRAYSHLNRFDCGREALPWLLTIANRRCVDLHRRRSKVKPVDPADYEWGSSGGDTTLDSVIASEQRRGLARALARIPWRQRRALLLYAVEGWSYPEICSIEGSTPGSTKALLTHARKHLRPLCRPGSLSLTFLAPLHRARAGARRLAGGVRTRFAGVAEPLIERCGESLSMVAAVLMLSISGGPVTPPADPYQPVEARTNGLGARAAPVHRPSSGGAEEGKANRSLQDDVLNPTGDATPETTHFYSLTPSPSFERDHTIFAAGGVPCARTFCPVLFQTRNGGTNWKPLKATGYAGGTVLLPPSFPEDPRIFVMGTGGLAQSDDAGETFRIVSPVSGGAAISPLFDRGDPRILLGSTALLDYWADRMITTPTKLAMIGATRPAPAFSPTYARDSLIFVGVVRPDTAGALASAVERCSGLRCATETLPGSVGVPAMRFSSRFDAGGAVYAFTSDGLFRSSATDSGFERIRTPGSSHLPILDVALTPPAGEPPALLVAAGEAGESRGLYRSNNDGASWTPLPTPLLREGVSTITALPTGTILATGADRGIACSADGGLTWTARC
ncbi:MAG: sigma-70 family RNA polymerase sigma factor [Actinomycetota bacterium]